MVLKFPRDFCFFFSPAKSRSFVLHGLEKEEEESCSEALPLSLPCLGL